MLAWSVGRFIGLGIILTFVCASGYAQQKVYKWVDEDGVVHFSEVPPDESEAAESETLKIAKPPPYVAPTQSVIRSPVASETDGDNQSAQPVIEKPKVVEKTDITTMSLPDLDRRCADGREKKLAPLREAEIARCKQEEQFDDPAQCERYYADYGDAGLTIHGVLRPQMFHDLPECVELDQERRRRAQ